MTIGSSVRSLVLGGLVGVLSASAFAMPQGEYLRKVEETRQNTRNGTSSWWNEAFDLLALLTEYGAQRVADQFAVVTIDAPKGEEWNYAFYHADRDTDVTLRYGWFGSTGLGAAASPLGAKVAGVRYEVNRFPETNVFVTLGESYDAPGGFALDYAIAGSSTFEPIFRATPLDAAGLPIGLLDTDGSNLAIGYGVILDVPEPASLALALTGLALLRRRCPT